MFFIFLINKIKYITWICLFWLGLSVCFAAIEIPFGNYIKAILILRFAPLFVGGIVFYLLKSKLKDVFLHILILLSLSTESYLLYQLDSDFIVYCIVASFYIVFYLFTYEKLGFISNKILVFLGSISYSLYLIHENIGLGLIYWLKKIVDVQLFYIPITVILVMIIASCITFFIEKPAMKWIRNYPKNNSNIK